MSPQSTKIALSYCRRMYCSIGNRSRRVMFSSQKILQNFLDFPSHRIFEHMYETLNIDKK
jgi:hypothetical protein